MIDGAHICSQLHGFHDPLIAACHLGIVTNMHGLGQLMTPLLCALVNMPINAAITLALPGNRLYAESVAPEQPPHPYSLT